MFTKFFVPALVAVAAVAPAQAAETINVLFTTPTGGQTVNAYSGIVNVRVSGTGFSLGSAINDAFYDVATQTLNSGYYGLAFGTAPLGAFTPSNNVTNFLVGSVPAFNPSNVYSFKLNTGLTTPGTLYFGVTDGNYGDNGGSFTLSIAAVPEPATWAMMIAGFGLVGVALRRRAAQPRTA